MRRVIYLVFACYCLAPPGSSAQTTTSQTPQAATLAAGAMAALTGGAQVSDVVLNGTATRAVGSAPESGTITLQALGNADSRLDFNGPSGELSEIRNADIGSSQGVWIDTAGITHPLAPHNCLTDAVWFFPVLSLLSQVSNSGVIVTYIGQEQKNGGSVQHLQFSRQFPSLDSTTSSFVVPLTTEDIYLDSTSLLPVAISFNAHPDNNVASNIPVEVDFSNYQLTDGVQVPFRIQESLNGGLFLDITVQSATLNSGLSQSTFSTN